jgi:RNA polymerase sigma-70 factor, ECF subfamily
MLGDSSNTSASKSRFVSVNTLPRVNVLINGQAIGKARPANREVLDVASNVALSFGIGHHRAVTAPSTNDTAADTALVAAARQGDRAAFGQLYARYARMVHGILLARVPGHEVEDLTQDVFLLALRRLASLRDDAAFGGWLAMIARNRANDFHRRSSETAELTEDVAADDPSYAEAAVVLAAIRKLPEAYRETLILRLVEGMTGPEIAARTGLTPGSVRVNLHRGMEQLRARLSKVSGKRDEL